MYQQFGNYHLKHWRHSENGTCLLNVHNVQIRNRETGKKEDINGKIILNNFSHFNIF